MSKKKAVQATTPSASQLQAVRRLVDAGDINAARHRLGVLLKEHPRFKPLLALAWELEDAGGVAMLAVARAYAWQQASPSSAAAAEALARSAAQAGLAALWLHAHGRQRALAGLPPEREKEFFDTPFGRLEFKAALAMDLSRVHLSNGHWAEVVTTLEGIDHPSARNNQALAYFASGQSERACTAIEANWQAEPGNLFALERLIRWRCWREGFDRCQGFVGHLKASHPERAQDAVSRVSALLFLGEREAARAAFEEMDQAPYWGADSPDLRAAFEALGQPDAQLLQAHDLWFPMAWVDAAVQIVGQNVGQNQDEHSLAPGSRWSAHMQACPAHTDYLQRVAELCDAQARVLSVSVLKCRAQLGDGAALAALRGLLLSPLGPDKQRSELLSWLAETGLHDRSQPIAAWLKGERRDVRSYGLQITTEPKPSPFGAKGVALNEAALSALRSGRYAQAVELAQQLRDLYPREPSALFNLATAMQTQGAAKPKVMALLNQAHALAPDYLFARCALASHHAEVGDVPKAQAMLSNVLDRPEIHITEYRSILLAQSALARAMGDHEGAAELYEKAREVNAEFHSMVGEG